MSQAIGCGMARIFHKLRQSLVVQVGLIYVIIAWIVFQIVDAIAMHYYLSVAVVRVTIELAITNFIVALWVAWSVGKVAPQDRLLQLVRLAWLLGPLFLVGNAGTLSARLSGGYLTPGPAPQYVLLFLLLIFITGIWILISSPFARTWAIRRANDREAFILAEQSLNWPFKWKEVLEMEPRIAPRLYFTFLAVIAATGLIVIETLIAEFLEGTFGLSGYTRTSLIAVGIATILYPVHKRASKYVATGHRLKADSGAADVKSAVSEILRASSVRFKLTFRYWYFYIPFIIVAGLLGWFITPYIDSLTF